MSTFTPFEEKMESAGVPAAAVKAFSRCYEALVSNHSGMIPEMDIQPADQVEDWQDITASTPAADKDLISQCVCIKLNGGLGTSMGLQKAKSLLKVKGEDTFLDLIVRQVKHLRSISGTPVRLLLMNSFSTSADTLAYLEKYASDGFADPAQVELMQNRVPKILADGLAPASCPEQPELEWCPPGHGDLYPALLGSGWLDRLLADGVKYAFVSNSDNLGAQLDMNFLRWFAESGAPFVMEVTRRTEADKKGGHLAVRKADGHLILREVAQCPDADIPEFQNISKHRYFNTNTLWIRLDALKEILDANGGVLPLPMIRNSKTLNPRDPESPRCTSWKRPWARASSASPAQGPSTFRVPGSSPSRPRPTCSCCVRTPSPWMKTARWPWLRNGKEKLPLWTWTPSCTSWWTPWTAWACLP